jgi:hypothetical protein
VTTVDPITGVDTNTMKVRSSVGAVSSGTRRSARSASTMRSRSARIRTTGPRSCGSPAARNSSLGVTRATAKVA